MVRWTVAATLLAAALGLVDLGREPLWHDEVFTAVVATRPTGLLLAILAEREGNMPLYYLLMHGWVQGGTGAGWLRTPSALAAAAAVPVTVAVARRAFDDRVAVLAGVLLAVNAFALDFARGARTYPLTMLLAATATLLLVKAVEGRSRSWWWAYGLAGLLAVGAQPLSGTLVLLAHALSLALLPREQVRWRAALGVLGGLLAVSAVTAAYIARVQSASTAHIEPVTFQTLTHFVQRLSGGRTLTVVFVVLGSVALLATARAGLRGSVEAWQRGLVVLWLLVPPVVLLVASELRPLWRSRYLIGVTPALAILIAVGIVRLRGRAVQAGCLAVVLGLSAISVRSVLRAPAVEDLPAGAELLVSASRPGDALVYSGAATRTPFRFVLEQQADGRPLPPDIAVAPDGDLHQVRDLFVEEVDAETLEARLRACRRVWVVSLPAALWHPTPEPMQAVQRTASWRASFPERDQHDFGGLRLELHQNELATDTARCGQAQ